MLLSSGLPGQPMAREHLNPCPLKSESIQPPHSPGAPHSSPKIPVLALSQSQVQPPRCPCCHCRPSWLPAPRTACSPLSGSLAPCTPPSQSTSAWLLVQLPLLTRPWGLRPPGEVFPEPWLWVPLSPCHSAPAHPGHPLLRCSSAGGQGAPPTHRVQKLIIQLHVAHLSDSEKRSTW